MATPDVTKAVELPSGLARNVRGRLRLVAQVDGHGFGYVTSTGTDLAGVTEVVADENGLLTFPDVTPNSLVTPANTVYELVVIVDGRAQSPEYLEVPDETGPVLVQDILTTAPAELPPQGASLASLGGVLDGTVASATIAETGGLRRLPNLYLPGNWDAEMRVARAAWARRASVPMNIWLGPGDSITEGYTATDIANTYAQKVAAALYRAAGQEVPVGYRSLSTLVDYQSGYTRTGTISNSANSGLGYGAQSIAKNATIDFTATADGVMVCFPDQSLNGQLRISVDSSPVSPNIIPVNNGSSVIGGRVWWSGALALEEHDFRLEGVDGLNFPGTAEGWFFTNGNGPTASAGRLDAEDIATGAGIRVWPGGHFGYNAGHFAAQPGAPRAWCDLATLAPCHLMVMALGTNDYGAARSTAQFAADLVTIVDMVETRNAVAGAPAPSVVLMTQFGTGATDGADSDEYRAAAWATAAAQGWAVIDWNAIMGYVGAGAGGDPLTLTADNLHPNDAGHAVMGAAIADQLLRMLAVNPDIYV